MQLKPGAIAVPARNSNGYSTPTTGAAASRAKPAALAAINHTAARAPPAATLPPMLRTAEEGSGAPDREQQTGLMPCMVLAGEGDHSHLDDADAE
jgi:hypothetical protein